MFFFDTYALCEMARGSPNYDTFSKEFELTTSLVNVYELYYILCRDNEPELAEKFFTRLIPCCIDILPEDIKVASKFRIDSRKNLSYIDALGYSVALRAGLQFVTGDEGFRGVKNVAFIK